jgi:hypothetical protein
MPAIADFAGKCSDREVRESSAKAGGVEEPKKAMTRHKGIFN